MHESHLHMLDWPDACVPVPGYDIPVLPACGIVNAAIAREIHRLGAAGACETRADGGTRAPLPGG